MKFDIYKNRGVLCTSPVFAFLMRSTEKPRFGCFSEKKKSPRKNVRGEKAVDSNMKFFRGMNLTELCVDTDTLIIRNGNGAANEHIPGGIILIGAGGQCHNIVNHFTPHPGSKGGFCGYRIQIGVQFLFRLIHGIGL